MTIEIQRIEKQLEVDKVPHNSENERGEQNYGVSIS